MEYKKGGHASKPCTLTILSFAALKFMQLAAPHLDQKSFVDGLMADFYHTAVIPYSKPPEEAL